MTQKQAKGLIRWFSKNTFNDYKAREQILNIISQQGSANQKHFLFTRMTTVNETDQ